MSASIVTRFNRIKKDECIDYDSTVSLQNKEESIFSPKDSCTIMWCVESNISSCCSNFKGTLMQI